MRIGDRISGAGNGWLHADEGEVYTLDELVDRVERHLRKAS